jgi:signal recognition particle receptor subunit beta
MAVFDPSEQRMCVRVVYDGAAGAGKTTNVRQLGTLFAAQRTTEVISPSELRGRTLFFDWMQIAAGAVCGFPLICQVVTVPGQAALSARRKELLASADVVVLVCESTDEGLGDALRALELADDLVLPSGEPLPVVIQANKQDQVGAIGGKALLAKIARPGWEVVEAIATEGIGVVDTFVAAVRTASCAIQARIGERTLRIPVTRVEDEHQLLARLVGIPIDREGAAELVLAEAAAAFVADDAPRPTTTEVLFDKPVGPVSTVQETHSAELRAPLPDAEVPAGFVWPAHTGRRLLATLGLQGSLALGPDGVKHRALDRVVSTSAADRFDDHEAARQALVRAARDRTQLERLLVTDTVLVVQPSPDGSAWLWMVTPETEPVAEWIAADGANRLGAFGTAIGDAMGSTLRHAIAFTPSLGAFGVQGAQVRYTGPLGGTGSAGRSALELVLGMLDEVAARGLDVEVFAAAVGHRLQDRLRPEDRALLAADCPISPAAAVTPKDRALATLVGLIRRVGEAA